MQSQPLCSSKKSGSLLLWMYLSNMVHCIPQNRLTVFLTTWLQYFLKKIKDKRSDLATMVTPVQTEPMALFCVPALLPALTMKIVICIWIRMKIVAGNGKDTGGYQQVCSKCVQLLTLFFHLSKAKGKGNGERLGPCHMIWEAWLGPNNFFHQLLMTCP